MSLKKLILIFILFTPIAYNCNSLNAKYLTNEISSNAIISFIVCEPGDEVYSSFGHAAIRVNDEVNGIDICFHWGLFDYSSDNFIYRFVKGETDYEMGAFDYRRFMIEYIERKSTVYEAVINLNQSEKQELYRKLIYNYLPENRTYRYNYVYDNCSTKPIELILKAAKNIKTPNEDQELTYRDIIWSYVNKGSLLSSGIDLVVSSMADEKIQYFKTTAFPLYALEYLQKCQVASEPLIIKTNTLYKGLNRSQKEKDPIKYILCTIALAIAAALAMYYYKTKKIPRISITVFLSIAIIIGLLITFLMFISEHPLVTWNYNILWLNPLLIISIIALYSKNKRLKLVSSFFFSAVTTTAGLIFCLSIQTACLPVICLWLIYITITSILFIDSLKYES